MGLSTQFACPVEGCDYKTYFRLGMGDEASPSAHAERVDVLRKEHPNHEPVAAGTAP